MDDADLFDVFNEDNNPEPQQKTIQGTKGSKVKKSKKEKKDKSKETHNGIHKKRSHEEINPSHDMEDEENEVIDNEESTRLNKKPRKIAEHPIVVDSFETETDQIVPATTGLQGTVPASDTIVLKKKVFLFHCIVEADL